MSKDDFKAIKTDLPTRFELLRLEEKHIDWASAIVTHSNVFHSPVWPVIYPEDRVGRAYKTFAGCDYLVRHQIESGLSFGIFDTEYKLRRPESKATDGKLYWDPSNPSKDESGEELLEQMDFPLCSVALSYDAIDPLDMTLMTPLVEALPAYVNAFAELDARDTRDPDSWKATGPRQVLMRNATSSRYDVEGKGIMKKLAYFLMRYADSLGYRGIQIECLHDKVIWVWSHPPSPFRADVVAEFDSAEYRIEVDGKTVNPFEGSKQRVARIYVTLKDESPKGHSVAPDSTIGGGLG